MELSEFERRVRNAALKLSSMCATEDPSEEEVKDATLAAGLPVTFPNDLFPVDPVRLAVFVLAYNPLHIHVTEDEIIKIAWNWHEREHTAA